jgi:germination protein M
MRTVKLFALAVAVIVSILACTRKEQPPKQKESRVSATKVYQKYFGPAPTTDKGSCYAFVIYFPSAKEAGKVVPFPFFTFDEATLKKVAVQRLIGGMADVRSYQDEILQPFPQGSRLLDLAEDNGVVTANFSKEVLAGNQDQGTQRALVNALVLTLRQFDGVNGVHILVDGKENPLDKIPTAPGESAVVQPSQPRLLSVTAMREQGAKYVEEVNAFFDRPVEIKMLQMSGPDGKPLQGDIYQSVFDMAGVMKPKDPSIFKAGMPIKVKWNVTDKMGRNATGDVTVPLEVKQH